MPPQTEIVSLNDMQAFMQDDEARLSSVRELKISFSVDFNALANDANARARTFEAMQNATEGIDRFATRDRTRNAVAQKICCVRLVAAKAPDIRLVGKTLVVFVAAARGFAGRPSSQAVQSSLARLLGVRGAATD